MTNCVRSCLSDLICRVFVCVCVCQWIECFYVVGSSHLLFTRKDVSRQSSPIDKMVLIYLTNNYFDNLFLPFYRSTKVLVLFREVPKF